MHLRLIAAGVLAGFVGVAPVANAQLPQRPLPQGMTQVPTGGGGGRILTAKMKGWYSAQKVFEMFRSATGSYFEHPFKLQRAFADTGDQNIQAAFTAQMKGVPVHGVVSVVMKDDLGEVTMMFDNARTFSKSFAALSHPGGGHGKMAEVKLIPQASPDGSAQISLPPGFRITNAFKGTLDIVGTQGATMSLGGVGIGTTRAAAPYFPGIAPVDFNDPVQAMVNFATYTGRQQGMNIRFKILDSKPVPGWTTGNAAFIRYSTVTNGKSYEGFGLCSVAPSDQNQAMIYLSYIAAPTETYRKQFPGMLRAWGTYSINPSVFTERLMAAAQTMRGMSDIISGPGSSYDYRQKVDAQVSEAWSDVFRDQGTWENPDTNRRYKVPNALTDDGGIPTINGTELQPVPLSQL